MIHFYSEDAKYGCFSGIYECFFIIKEKLYLSVYDYVSSQEVKNTDDKTDILYIANLQKFAQNSNLLELLFETCGSDLVELSTYDKEWNLGKSLERVRAELLEKNFNETLEEYEYYNKLQLEGPPEFYGYDIGRQEANYECMMFDMYDNLKDCRDKLKHYSKLIIRGGFNKNIEQKSHDILKLIEESMEKKENEGPYKVSIKRTK